MFCCAMMPFSKVVSPIEKRAKRRHFGLLSLCSTKMKTLLLVVSCLAGSSLGLPFDDCPAAGTVSRLDRSQGAIVVEEAPSPSPSVAPLCTSQTSNARGQYTATLAPCTFRFHSIQAEDDRLIDFQTSNLCSDENSFLTLKEYVYDWGDECVGDFARCYSLEHHKSLLFHFLCAMDWNLPEETTHVSVSCVEDKTLVLEAEEHHAHETTPTNGEARIEQIELSLFNAVLIMCCCLVGIFVISRTIVKPLVSRSAFQLDQARSCSCRNREDQHNPLPCNCGNEGNSVGSWISPQRLSLEIEDSDCFAEPVHEDFDSQIPADFDAVPIVAATILPDED